MVPMSMAMETQWTMLLLAQPLLDIWLLGGRAMAMQGLEICFHMGPICIILLFIFDKIADHANGKGHKITYCIDGEGSDNNVNK